MARIDSVINSILLKTKSIHIDNVDNTYQHDSSVLLSNHESTLKTNNCNSFLWNRTKIQEYGEEQIL